MWPMIEALHRATVVEEVRTEAWAYVQGTGLGHPEGCPLQLGSWAGGGLEQAALLARCGGDKLALRAGPATN